MQTAIWFPIIFVILVLLGTLFYYSSITSLSSSPKVYKTLTSLIMNHPKNYLTTSRRVLLGLGHLSKKWDRRNVGNDFDRSNNRTNRYRQQRIPPGSDSNVSWESIKMPLKSYFAGFSAPDDLNRWRVAAYKAKTGELVLLKKILQVIKSPFDLHKGDNVFKWIHQIADYHKSKTSNWLKDLVHSKGHMLPIVMLGHRFFDRPDFEGLMTGHESMGPNEIIANKDFTIPRKIIGIGNMDENWGWLSTYFLNRTVPWAMSFGGEGNPYYKNFRYSSDDVKPILDNKNLIMVLTNQHHNISHPKVISLPMGLNDQKGMYLSMLRAVRQKHRKEHLLFTAGSNYGFRPAIRACIARRLGPALTVSRKVEMRSFQSRLITSYAVLAMPGLGYDTYRHWEALAAGSMPVVERGMGMDRTFFRLPVLMLDDFYDISEHTLRQAYVEALYRADDWEYERMTRRWWTNLLYEVSAAGNVDPLLKKHPMEAEDSGFTRPLVPFDCEAMGGCGPGTKRTPKKSCAIDPSVMSLSYKWDWNHHNPD